MISRIVGFIGSKDRPLVVLLPAVAGFFVRPRRSLHLAKTASRQWQVLRRRIVNPACAFRYRENG